MDDERPPAPGRGMRRRFLLAAVLIALLSGGATATVALNTVSGIAAEVFPRTIRVPKGVVTPVYSGGPQAFLILCSDRRQRAGHAFDCIDPQRGGPLLLRRFAPAQGQT